MNQVWYVPGQGNSGIMGWNFADDRVILASPTAPSPLGEALTAVFVTRGFGYSRAINKVLRKRLFFYG
ncbi:MAG: hypothetical protein WBS24_09750 [Terriglobales bacterium]